MNSPMMHAQPAVVRSVSVQQQAQASSTSVDVGCSITDALATGTCQRVIAVIHHLNSCWVGVVIQSDVAVLSVVSQGTTG
jgi:hypothetical protein